MISSLKSIDPSPVNVFWKSMVILYIPWKGFWKPLSNPQPRSGSPVEPAVLQGLTIDRLRAIERFKKRRLERTQKTAKNKIRISFLGIGL